MGGAEATLNIRPFIAAVFVILAGIESASPEPRFGFDSTPGKLPKDVRPLAYRIELAPDLDQLAAATGKDSVPFNGVVEVDIEARRPVTAIRLNARDIAFTSAAVDGARMEITVDSRNEVATLTLQRPLTVGRHKLSIRYSGTILPRPDGIFYSVYETPAGQRLVLGTDLEPSGARRIFPAWDEPVFKATFTLSVVVPANYRALSNMPVAREEVAEPNRKTVTFATTPKMSTYLFVLVAGEFERITTTAANVDIGVVAPPHQIEQGRFALDAAGKVIPFYTDYFGSRFPLPKLDNILIAGNFFNAMENWGGVTYDERGLLFDPARASQESRQYVFETVAHELAHQWFGNLVTNAWWDNLWLNEGFAAWMQKKATHNFNPAWKTWVRAHADKEKALTKDALRTAHAVQQPIDDESQALAAFDDITYWKGMSIVRMLESYLGEDPFRDGIRRYMKAHAYSSTTTADLWAALEAASRKPVAKIAAGFAEQPGIPLITVATTCASGKLMVTLRQDRYTLNDPYAVKQVWQVPVALGRPGDAAAARTILVGANPATATFDGCDRPVKANFGDVGYYRVQYDDAALKALTAVYRRLPAADRVNLMADTWAMVMAGRAAVANYLDLARQLSDETEHAVWEAAVASLRMIDDLIVSSPARNDFRAFARNLIRPVLERVGWEPRLDDTPETLLVRALAISMLGRLRDDAVIAEARRRFAALVQDGALHKDLRGPVATAVGHVADRRIYEDLRRLAGEAAGDEEKMTYYLALAGAGEPELIDETVKIARSDPNLPRAQAGRFLERAAMASGDADRVWKLAHEHRREILERLADFDRQKALPNIARLTSSPSIAFELKWGSETRLDRGMRLRADEAVEEIEAKAEFKLRLVPAVETWLKDTGG